MTSRQTFFLITCVCFFFDQAINCFDMHVLLLKLGFQVRTDMCLHEVRLIIDLRICNFGVYVVSTYGWLKSMWFP